jgi:3-hydroxybutyrate dehydrogenase
MTTLAGKTALVTGSTSGIGLGIARALAEAGANIVLNGFGDIAAALALIRSHGVQAWHHPADLSDPAQIDALCAFAAHETGGVDILVNNAGIQHVAPIEAFPPAVGQGAGHQPERGVPHQPPAAAHHAPARLGPHHQYRLHPRSGGSSGKSAYVAAKHGVLGLTKTVALETAHSPVTCNAICPGWVLTPLVAQQIAERASARASARSRPSTICWPKNNPPASLSPRATGCAGGVFVQPGWR